MKRADRIHSAVRELTFTGDVMSVDPKAQTFTVRHMVDGKVEEMAFHVNPAARLYVGDEAVLLREIRPGDAVTVAYDLTAGPHFAKNVKKHS